MDLEEVDDRDLLIDLSQHGFDFQASQTGPRGEGAGPGAPPARGGREGEDVRRVERKEEGPGLVIDLVSPEPPARTRQARREEGAGTSVVTIDLLSSSSSGQDSEVARRETKASSQQRVPLSSRRDVVDQVLRNANATESGNQGARGGTKVQKPKTAARKRSVDEERQAARLAVKRSRGDFALDEVTVLVSSEAIEHTNLVGLKLCEAVKEHGMKYAVRSGLPVTEVPTVFWRSSRGPRSEAVGAGDGVAGSSGSVVPCVAAILEASEFIRHLDQAEGAGKPCPDFLSSMESKCEGYAVYCVLVGWERELQSREKRVTSFSPVKYERKIVELAVMTRGLQIHKVHDARGAAEYLASLSAELAKLPYASAETSVVDYCKKVKTIFQGGRMGCQTRVWINMIHQLPQVGIKAAESIAGKFRSFAELMRAYTSPGLGDSEKRRILQDLPMTDRRSVGPSISSKCFDYFTARNGEDALE
ncbi:hypothetical protein HOP50_11g63370 [Chloropicon primus]|uniref:ERCC4 domain-containing protein n=2 Tax=Chloropicon primus TaxID=1764295 RepID=A0A5B8MTX1_9CHLO|nr:hypothetical protein A3770_11p63150 [Chloropicon primus]UPR03010.1 hypothetical protein HOP50_11g63370 [Chloropicon primus]|eukprot:QDZ23797.1 hypothetical protein A3770_11p63150 [Chloropicon primus]